jgi:hypothetical protein
MGVHARVCMRACVHRGRTTKAVWVVENGSLTLLTGVRNFKFDCLWYSARERASGWVGGWVGGLVGQAPQSRRKMWREGGVSAHADSSDCCDQRSIASQVKGCVLHVAGSAPGTNTMACEGINVATTPTPPHCSTQRLKRLLKMFDRQLDTAPVCADACAACCLSMLLL